MEFEALKAESRDELIARIDRLMRLGHWEAAELACREWVTKDPLAPEAWSRSGIVALFRERFEDADIAFGQALVLAPQRADLWGNRSIARFRLARFDEAESDAREAVAREQSVAIHWQNLGACLSGRGKWTEAAAAYREAVARDANNATAWASLAAAQQWLGNLAAAEECFQKSFVLRPGSAETLTQYAYLLLGRGQIEQAFDLLARILKEAPHTAEAWNALANAHLLLDQLPEAEAAYRRALELSPGYRVAQRDYARLLVRRGMLNEAEQVARRLVEGDSRSAEGWDLLGAVLYAEGRIDEAVAAHRRCMELEPSAVRHSSLLCDLQYAEGVMPEQLLAAHRAWDAAHGRAVAPKVPARPMDRAANRPLRLGFVSADFAGHPTGCLVLPALENMDRAANSIVCYSDRVLEDEYTARFRAVSDQWRVTHGLADEELAAQIRQDEIDILFDLMGHTGGRLMMFARKPAPLQVSWLGYVGTTGLAAMDCLLADRFHVRDGEEPWYCERIVRMPAGYVCYGPPRYSPEVPGLPALATGRVTFGCFNNPAKFSRGVLEVWATILRRVPGAGLLLKYGGLDDVAVQDRLREQFASRGVAGDRIVLEGRSPHAELLAAYGRVDLALDTQPYSGGLTTCEALWMGVPVITWPGKTFAGRHSTSHLINAGYPQFVAEDANGYIELAVQWAARLDELAAIRLQMRERVRQSALCDSPRFARDLQAIVREAWNARFCSQT